MDTLINDLRIFTEQSFPVTKVTSYLRSLDLQKEQLEKYCYFNRDFYTRNLVHKEKGFELMVVCWSPGQKAPIHGHEGEKCWARIQKGSLQVCNYKEISSDPINLDLVERVLAKKGYLDGPADIHSVENISNDIAVSLHVYARPFDSCDIYDMETGVKNRIQLQYHSMFGKLC